MRRGGGLRCVGGGSEFERRRSLGEGDVRLTFGW